MIEEMESDGDQVDRPCPFAMTEFGKRSKDGGETALMRGEGNGTLSQVLSQKSV